MKQIKSNRKAVTQGSGNIFADLGLPNSEEHLLKAKLALVVADEIKRHGLSQTAAARRMNISQPDVSKILRGRFAGFSLERLLGFLMALGNDVTIAYAANDAAAPGQLRLAQA